MVPPRLVEAVEGSLRVPSKVANAVLYTKEIGWSFVRSVPILSFVVRGIGTGVVP
jgi:hypothetical protein